MDGAIIGTVLILLGGASFYSYLLDKLNRCYEPDWTILTVVGGEGLVGAAAVLLCWYAVLPWMAFWMFVVLQATAAIPIAIWQYIQAKRRTREYNESVQTDGTAH